MRCPIHTDIIGSTCMYIHVHFPAYSTLLFSSCFQGVLPSSLELECLLLFPLVTFVPTLPVSNLPYQFSLSPSLDCVTWPPHQKSCSSALTAYWPRGEWLFAEGIEIGPSPSVWELRVSPEWWRDPLTQHPGSFWASSMAGLTASLSWVLFDAMIMNWPFMRRPQSQDMECLIGPSPHIIDTSLGVFPYCLKCYLLNVLISS